MYVRAKAKVTQSPHLASGSETKKRKRKTATTPLVESSEGTKRKRRLMRRN